MTPAIVGIDLGTANARVAGLDERGPRILEDADGRRAIRSVVATGPDGAAIVGDAARRGALAGVPWVPAGTAETGAPEALAAVLRALAAAAEHDLGVPVRRAVVTVPAGFDDARRRATLQAGAIAGLEVVRILNAPTAAALAYRSGRSGTETIAVVDVGAGSCEAMILRCEEGLIEAVGCAGDLRLGGEAFDGRLAGVIADELRAGHGADVAADPIARQRLLDDVEAVKRELSRVETSAVGLAQLATGPRGPVAIGRQVTRAELERLTTDLADEVEAVCRAALASVGDPVEVVVAVGGMTRMPALARRIAAVFGVEPVRGVHRDEAIALGAAIEGAILDGRIGDLVLVDQASHTVGLRAAGDRFVAVVRRGAALPARVRKVFATGDAGRLVVEVCQGDDPVASRNRRLARLHLPEVPAGHVELVFTIDPGGCLGVTARDPRTGTPCVVEIAAAPYSV